MAKVIHRTSSLLVLGSVAFVIWLETGFSPAGIQAMLGNAGCSVGSFIADLPLISLILSIFR